MKKNSMYWGIGAVLVAAVLVITFYNPNSDATLDSGAYDSFAKCMTEKGVKMFGAYWCPHCQNQEKMFGDSWKYVTYIECSLPNRQGQTEVCSAAGIKGYPTWEFPGGERISGEMTLGQLSTTSGCPLE